MEVCLTSYLVISSKALSQNQFTLRACISLEFKLDKMKEKLSIILKQVVVIHKNTFVMAYVLLITRYVRLKNQKNVNQVSTIILFRTKLYSRSLMIKGLCGTVTYGLILVSIIQQNLQSHYIQEVFLLVDSVLLRRLVSFQLSKTNLLG